MKNHLDNFVHYLACSFGIASVMYYAVGLFTPDHIVFGSLYGMSDIHRQHPLAFILIPCLIYSLLATALTQPFADASKGKRWGFTAFIVIVTITLSSPIGGVLWYHYQNNTEGSIQTGALNGLKHGWLIIAYSIPYNVLGVLFCHWMTTKFASVFTPSRKRFMTAKSF